jgi:hypothetical protein
MLGVAVTLDLRALSLATMQNTTIICFNKKIQPI